MSSPDEALQRSDSAIMAGRSSDPGDRDRTDHYETDLRPNCINCTVFPDSGSAFCQDGTGFPLHPKPPKP